MLHAYPLMADIDVNYWRNLQSLLLESAKGKRRIILIHENGELLKFVHSRREEIVRNVDRVDDPHQVAEQVYRDNEGKADFVVVFERNAVDRYTAQFQDTWKADEDLDEFVHRQFTLMDDYGDGIVTYPRPARETLGLQWRVGASYEEVKAAVHHFVPPNSTIVFGIFEGDTLWATLVLRFDADHRANVVTTVDPSELTSRGEREAIAKEVVAWVNRKYPTCSMGLFTDLDSARTLISSRDKVAIIRNLAEQHKLIEEIAALQETVLSKGPNGEEATPTSEISLTDQELEQIRGMNATAAILMHYGSNDWSVAQIAGLRSQFEEMGIEVIATTDANFKPETQVSNIETVLAQNPDIIVSLPTDPSATADAFQRAAEQGVKLVFMDNVPQGLEQGTDYVSLVSADNYGNGVVSAHLMAQELGEQGKIGIVYHASDFFVTQQRYDAFKGTIQEDYPNIEIVEEQGIGGPDFAGDADRAAAAMLTKHPDLNGIWAVWDVPAEGVMSAIRRAGRSDVIVTTIDLGKTIAAELARGGVVKGLGAQRPFDHGVTPFWQAMRC